MPPTETISNKLTQLKKYAEDVVQALTKEPPTDREAVRTLRAEAEKTARRTLAIASGPVRIGVVGEFNAGKSMLLGALIGCGEALPVSSIPSTGNITALRFLPVDELKTTELSSYTVQFLDENRLHQCFVELVHSAIDRAKKAQIDPGRLSTVAAELSTGTGAITDSFCTVLVSWGQEAWGASQDPGLRRVIRELVWLARARAALPGVLNTQRTFDRETASKGLLLPGAIERIAQISFEELIKSLPQLPRPPLVTPPDTWSEDLLQAAFPLIRQVEIEVRISRDVWDLSQLRGVNEFVLLDFPGLGAAESSVRDEFLCRSELAEVQTILLLINSQRTGAGREAQIIFNMLQDKRSEDLRDFILVGVSRFDDLPLLEEGREQRLDALLETAGPPAMDDDWSDPEEYSKPLTDKEVYNSLDVLNTVVSNAQSLTTRTDRIVFLSALLAFDRLPQSSDFEIGSREFLVTLRNRMERPRRLQEKWGKLAGLLDAGSPLGGWLSEFGRDGGISRLRRLLEEHTATHGLRTLFNDAEKEARRLERILQDLDRADSASTATGLVPGGVETINQALSALQNDYEKFDDQFRNVQTELYIQTGSGPVLLSDWVQTHLRDELVGRFFRLPEWSVLMMHLRDGRVQLPEQSASEDGWGDPGEEAMPTAVLPVCADDFYKPFADTLKALDEAIHKRIVETIPAVLQQMAEQLQSRREAIMGIIVSEVEAKSRVGVRNTPGETALVSALMRALDPTRIKEQVLKRWQNGEKGLPDPAVLFPFPRAEGAVPGRQFPWSPAVKNTDRNHFLEILRYRNEMMTALSHPLTQHSSRLIRRLAGVMTEFVKDTQQKLNLLANNPGLIAHLAGDVSSEMSPRLRSQAAAVVYPRFS
jgi:hypothetical protein